MAAPRPLLHRTIKMNAFEAEPEDLVREELAAVERVIRTGHFILGKEVERFETEWAEYCGTPYAVGVGNGMEAIEIGLRALGVGPGHEVITTPMTAFATVLAILRVGAAPVLADIDPATALLDPDSAGRCVSSRTRAVLPVHLYGQIAGMDRWEELCRAYGLFLIEDAAQAHGARWHGHAAGSFGDCGAFSFYPTKNLGTFGDGGMLITHDPGIAQAARQLRNYGQAARYHHPVIGLNSRLDEMHASILRTRLRWLTEFTHSRQEIARTLHATIKNAQIRPLAPPNDWDNHVYHLFVVRCTRREQAIEFLANRGIETLIHYPIPVHHQPPCRDVLRDPQGLFGAEQHARECFSLPCHPQLCEQDVIEITDAVNAFG